MVSSLSSFHLVHMCFCHGGAVLLELVGEEALPVEHLLVPGLQYPPPLSRLQAQSVGVGLLYVPLDGLQTVDVLKVPTHHAHQQLVQWVVVHEVVVPPEISRQRSLLTGAVEVAVYPV